MHSEINVVLLYPILKHLPYYVLLLAVYFIYTLDYGNDVRHKVNSSDFLEFKMGDKAAETTHNINNTFGSGKASEHTVPGWFRKFCKGDEGIEVEERGVWPSEVDNDQLRTSSRLILLELHKKFPKSSTSTLLCHSAFEAYWKGDKT